MLFLTGLSQELSFSLSEPQDLIGRLAGFHEFAKTDYIADTAQRLRHGERFSEAWAKALGASEVPFDDEDRRILLLVGGILGASDLESQLNGLSHCAEQLKMRLRADQPKVEERSKLARTIGLLAGVCLAVLLL